MKYQAIAAYSSGLDRFFFVDQDRDVFTTLRAAKILDPKILLSIYAFEGPTPFDTLDAINWTLTSKSDLMSMVRGPHLHREVLTSKDVVKVGPPADFADDIDRLRWDQGFATFTLKALRSALLVRSFSHHIDRAFYTGKYFPDWQEDPTRADLVAMVETALFAGSSVKEVKELLEIEFATRKSPGILNQIATFKDFVRW